MPSVIHFGDEFINLPDASSATENGGTNAQCRIQQKLPTTKGRGTKGCGQTLSVNLCSTILFQVILRSNT